MFGAWSYQTTKMNLTTNRKTINLEGFEENGEWEIMRTEVSQQLQCGISDPQVAQCHAGHLVQLAIFLAGLSYSQQGQNYIGFYLNKIYDNIVKFPIKFMIYYIENPCSPSSRKSIDRSFFSVGAIIRFLEIKI